MRLFNARVAKRARRLFGVSNGAQLRGYWLALLRAWAALRQTCSRLVSSLRDHCLEAWNGPAYAAERLDVGHWGEWWAARTLRKLGYRVLFTRWTDGIGELDLIAWYQGRIVFVEVKARRASEKKSGFYPATISTLMDDALAAVDEEKKRRVTRASLRFLKRHRLLGYPCRFDIVAVAALDARHPSIQHWEGAFDATGSGGSMY